MRISEIFFSVQGEGIEIGTPTIFIRTAGCNLNCEWCDTRYALANGRECSVNEIVSEIKHYPSQRVCITGGEPLLQSDIIDLIEELLNAGYRVSVETNGSLSIENLLQFDALLISMDIKCPSSKMQGRNDFSNLKRLRENDQLKFVIKDRKDYDYAKRVIEEHDPKCNVIFQPVWGTELRWIADRVLNDCLRVRVLVQLHKLIWGDRRRV